MKELLLVWLLAIGYWLLASSSVFAVSGSDWQAGRIIDDSVFSNANSMSVSQIQDFLNDKVPNCDSDHPEGSGWRDIGPPYVCLKSYREDPNVPIRDCTQSEINKYFGFGPSDPRYETALNYCWWKDGRANIKGQAVSSNAQSAAQIIYNAAQDYSINPQVLIVTLQKEQSLITDTWPWVGQFQKAMGYACPDTAACNPSKRGFYNQVRNAAWQLRRYVDYPQNYNFAVGTRFIQYHPDSGCGGTNVKIQTAATAALYNYTPYQPNQAALNNLYGTGNDCSSYGNRNFWRMFNDWFGSTEGTVLFRIGDTAPVYILGADNNYYHIPSYELLKAYGYPLSVPKIASMSSSYIEGRTNSGVLPRMARFEGSAVYLIDRGERHWFDSIELIENYGYAMGEEALLPSLSAFYYPETDNVATVIKEYAGPGIYLMEDGKKRHITSLDAFQTGSPAYSSRDYVRLSVDYTFRATPGPSIYAYMTLLRIDNQDAVYLVNTDNTYLYVPSKELLGQYGIGLDQAMNVSAADAAGYGSAGNLRTLAKKPSGAVWMIQDGVRRRHVSAAMLDASKYNVNSSIIPQLPESFIISFKSAPELTEVIQAEGDARVYLVQNGAKRWATSWMALNNLGYDQDDLTVVSSVFLATLPSGSDL